MNPLPITPDEYNLSLTTEQKEFATLCHRTVLDEIAYIEEVIKGTVSEKHLAEKQKTIQTLEEYTKKLDQQEQKIQQPLLYGIALALRYFITNTKNYITVFKAHPLFGKCIYCKKNNKAKKAIETLALEEKKSLETIIHLIRCGDQETIEKLEKHGCGETKLMYQHDNLFCPRYTKNKKEITKKIKEFDNKLQAIKTYILEKSKKIPLKLQEDIMHFIEVNQHEKQLKNLILSYLIYTTSYTKTPF